MEEAVDVSASTVRTRIDDMEAAGIIEGCSPHVDYAKVGSDLHVLAPRRADTDERERPARAVLDIDGVDVHERLDSHRTSSPRPSPGTPNA